MSESQFEFLNNDSSFRLRFIYKNKSEIHLTTGHFISFIHHHYLAIKFNGRNYFLHSPQINAW